MQVAHFDSGIVQVVGEVLRHLLCQCRDKDPLILLYPHTNRLQEIVDLPFHGFDDNLRVHKSCGANDLLDDGVGKPQLVGPWCCRQVQFLPRSPEELIEAERSVIHGAGKPETMLHECSFSRCVTLVHPANLGNGDVGFIYHGQKVIRKIVEQTIGRLTWLAPVYMAGVVLNARAKAKLLHHFQVIGGPHPNSLRFEQLPLALQLSYPLLKFSPNCDHCALHGLRRSGVVRGRKYADGLLARESVTGDGVQIAQRFDLVAEHFDSNGKLLVHRNDFYGVPSDPKCPTLECDVVALVLHLHKGFDKLLAGDVLSYLQRHHRLEVVLRCSEAIDTGHSRDHNHVSSAEE